MTALVSEPNALARHFLRAACERAGAEVVGECASLEELVPAALAARPGIVVSEASLEDGPLEEVLDDLVAAGSRVLVVCDDPSPERVTEVLLRGASGYLLREAGPDRIGDAVTEVAAGGVVLDPGALAIVVEQWRWMRRVTAREQPRAGLTPRETDVLAAMAEGLPTKGIAHRLGVAVKTVENHKIRVFDKLGVRSQAQAVAHAIGLGLLTVDPADPGPTPDRGPDRGADPGR